MKIGIVGYGHVGTAMHELFVDAVVFDKYKKYATKEEINACDLAFVCVPTPRADDGSCDTTMVEEVIEWIETEIIVLRSTVPVGFTDEMIRKYGKKIVFQPEYYGETVAHPFASLRNQNWLSFGGETESVKVAIRAYQDVINSNVRINIYPAKEVELAKYMENAFLATKVVFCNEMYDIASKLGVNYDIAREVWISDPRIGASHTFVYPDKRGYGGSCLPKDISSLEFQGKANGVDVSLISAVIAKNDKLNKDANSASKVENKCEE